MTIQPLDQILIDPVVAALPKADLHLHQEAKARLGQIAARLRGVQAFDRRSWIPRVLEGTPAGMGRLDAVYLPDEALDLDGVSDDDPEIFIARVVDVLEEGAADGAVLIEVRFGANELVMHPDFVDLFREAERRAQERYPQLRAEAIGFLNPVEDVDRLLQQERLLEICIQAARQGLAGVDFRVDPYDTEANPALWETAYRWAERAADAGMGVTVHAGEFSTANIAAALRMPHLRRLGHGVYAATDERLLEQIAESRATIEFSLTCNVVLGAVPSYEAHPIRRFVDAGIPVTLNTDLPAHVCTTIGREYAIAARSLGFSPAELLGFTRNAVNASFTTPERRTALLSEVQSSRFKVP
jgi:adenosine deaminase